ncbi:hypothetical protein B0A48_03985 [Cryoendolithus antarcticus]|uniref:Uncharacterized protein n=1 Tax=Cryoendolithus antarcticus TaxID=1507870 RepID=A0A1V8TH38_9PEZI|nr:hypothetical protein B0A48_03985 [Cryoendolithus antarcticus]
MKSINALLTAMLACVFFAQNAVAIDDATRCSQKYGSVVNAIGKFCTKNGQIPLTQMFSPGPFTNEGVWSNDKKVTIWLNGNCNPKQYIPPYWCFNQLYNMCANGNKKGEKQQRYGTNGCQTWNIMVPSYHGN